MRSHISKSCSAMLACWLLTMGISAFAAESTEVAGVKLESVVNVAGSPLQLNGAGVRYKAVFPVYVGALYIGRKVATPEQFFATQETKRIRLTMLREIDSNELGKAFMKGFQDNAPKGPEMGKLLPGLARMGQVFAEHKKLLKGDTITVDWVPGTGAVITIAGDVQGEPFKDVEFYNAVLRIWLGSSPADAKLKEALLGKPGAEQPGNAIAFRSN